MIELKNACFTTPTRAMADNAGIGELIGWQYLKSYPIVGRWAPYGFRFIGTDGILETDLEGTPTRASAIYALPTIERTENHA